MVSWAAFNEDGSVEVLDKSVDSAVDDPLESESEFEFEFEFLV
jgi:hypothetical protein